MSNDPTPGRILQLGMGFWGAKTLLSAVELGLFTELAGHPLDAQALQEGLGPHSRSARDFFDALGRPGHACVPPGPARQYP